MRFNFIPNESFDGGDVSKAVEIANTITEPDSGFFREIAAHRGFKMADATPREVSACLSASNLVMRVEIAPHGGRKTLAWVDGDPNVLFINSNLMERNIASLVGSIIHEWVHAVDNTVDENFGHGRNFLNRFKQQTAPYWIGNLATEFAARHQRING